MSKRFIARFLVVCFCTTAIPIVERNALAMSNSEIQALKETNSISSVNRDSENMKATPLPEKYNHDENNMLYQTPIKSQNGNNCWAFATIAAAETNALRKGIYKGEGVPDYSEQHLTYFNFNHTSDPLDLTTKDKIISDYPMVYLRRGRSILPTLFRVSQGVGPINESKAVYNPNSEEGYYDAKTEYQGDLTLKDGFELNRKNIDSIKKAIMQYGAVTAAYHSGGGQQYIHFEGDGYDHAVTLVGWDDTISKDKFGYWKPSRDGAWVVKNSWGERGTYKYNYISYDTSIYQVFVTDYVSRDSYDFNYHYDGTVGVNNFIGKPGEVITSANIYEAKKGEENKEEYLEAVGIGIATINTDYEIQIYKNPKNNNPESGEKMLDEPLKGSKSYNGYYTIPLKTPVLLKKGDKFSIVVKLTNRSNTEIVGVYTTVNNLDRGDYEFIESTEANQSYVRSNSNEWIDLHTKQTCARIRGLTSLRSKSELENKTDLKESDFSLKENNQEYSGYVIEPEIVVKQDLMEMVDYIVEYKDNIEVGKGQVLIHGIGKYSGTITLDFNIVPYVISEKNVQEIPYQIKTGSQIKPSETVKLYTRTLERDKEYTVSYGDNITKEGFVKITGKGNFAGSISVPFDIVETDRILSFQAISNNPSYGSTSVKSTARIGEQVKLVAVSLSDNYLFYNWVVDGKELTKESEYHFTAKESFVAYANFIERKTTEELKTLYNQHKNIQNNNYSENSWNTFKEALDKAKSLADSGDSDSDNVSICYEDLRQAKENLKTDTQEKEFSKSDLQSYYDKVKEISEDNYEQDSFDKFKKALEEAKAVLESQSSTKDQIDTVLTNLKDAKNALVEKTIVTEPIIEPVNKDELKNKYTEYTKLNKEDYTTDSWASFKNALDNAKTVLDNENAQKTEVDSALETLNSAKTNLKNKPEEPKPPVVDEKETVNKDELQNKYTEYTNLNKEDYTEDSWASFKNALDNANKVLNNANAQKTEVDAALETLNTAKANLKNKPEEPKPPVVDTKETVNARIFGNNRYETSYKLFDKGWTSAETVILASGVNYPDALTATPLASKHNAPILLSKNASLNSQPELKSALANKGVKNVIIVGGESVISKALQDEISSLGINVRRIGGSDRYETSALIAKEVGVNNGEVALAYGLSFADGLSIASIAGKKQIPILLTKKDSIPDSTKNFLNSNNINKTYIIGGTGVISTSVSAETKNPERLGGANRYETNSLIFNRFKSEIKLDSVYIASGLDFPDALSSSALAAKNSNFVLLSNTKKAEDSVKNIISQIKPNLNNSFVIGGNVVISEDTISELGLK